MKLLISKNTKTVNVIVNTVKSTQSLLKVRLNINLTVQMKIYLTDWLMGPKLNFYRHFQLCGELCRLKIEQRIVFY